MLESETTSFSSTKALSAKNSFRLTNAILGKLAIFAVLEVQTFSNESPLVAY